MHKVNNEGRHYKCLQKLFQKNLKEIHYKNIKNNVLQALCQNKTCSRNYFLPRYTLVELISSNIIAKYNVLTSPSKSKSKTFASNLKTKITISYRGPHSLKKQ